ncbi:MAG: DUF4149 domain-containing protein [Pseudomonadota bacterium]
MSLAISLHVLAAVIWVGGMFFAYIVLRPVAARQLNPELRLKLWRENFRRFFTWVWAAALILLTTGYWIVFQVYSGMAQVGLHIHIMQGLGILMMLIFAHVYFAPFQRLKRNIDAGDLPAAAKDLALIRKTIAINLTLGLILIVVATGGKYL